MTLPTFGFSTTADEVATVLADEIKGKTVLVTGTSLNGIGFETARAWLSLLKLSEEAIKHDVPAANIRPLVLDLSSLSSVRKAAAEVNAYPEPLHVLINNAAAAVGPLKLTVDSLENQLATGHIGPFLLTKLLAPKLFASSASSGSRAIARVVFVSSMAQARCKWIDFARLGRPDPAKYTGFGAYAVTKAANVLTARALCSRSNGRINGYSLNPGGVFTNINQKEESIADLKSVGILLPNGQLNMDIVPWKTIPQGAATTLVAAFDPRLSGAYLDDCIPANQKLSSYCADPLNAEKLWAATEEVIGERFTFQESFL
ncbi:hypothetical protein C8R45DRAFT_1112289 [Mycena sanguinolenta]|nr:hypothetical protein C8R45DRAFT_1112289 [Mycena sanguinolenta]